MSIAMRMKIGDLSADNARGRGGGVRGGRLLGRWRRVGRIKSYIIYFLAVISALPNTYLYTDSIKSTSTYLQ